MSSKFGVELSATVTFDHPTLQSLAQFLVETMAPDLSLPMPSARPAGQSEAIVKRIEQVTV